MSAAPPGQSGTDAESMPVFVQEDKILGVARSRWPSILAPLVIGILALAFWNGLSGTRISSPMSCRGL